MNLLSIKIIIFCVLKIYFVGSFVTEALHELMTEPELMYYFQTENKNSVPEYEVVYMPVIMPIRESIGENGLPSEEIDYSFSVFQRPIDLKLRRNDGIISPSFKTFIHNQNGIEYYPYRPENCHYLHNDGKSVASISICEPKTLQGLVFLDNSTFEIHPLSNRLQNLVKQQESLIEALELTLEEKDDRIPHIVKRSVFESENLHSDIFPIARNVFSENYALRMRKKDLFHLNRRTTRAKTVGGLTLEVALFLDEEAYKIFAPYLNNEEKKLQDMLLAYMNGVQALYHHPSLGNSLELVLVRMDMMKKQHPKMPHYDGERGKLLDSFCAYQENINPPGDKNPNHWDMALYISGLDFYHIEDGRKSGITMGLATVGGVCLDKYACVIAELGTTNVFGKPYPSAGFTSVYILAHEIGHNLGMHHDSSGNSCPKEGYIMSPSRGTNGETLWSSCSAEVMSKLSWATCLTDSAKAPKNLDHSKFKDSPGQTYTAKKQCEILLRDRDAVVSPNQQLSTICYNLQCKTPHRSGYYFAGPALEGTQCGNKQYCFGGDCVNKTPQRPTRVVPGGWSQWNAGKCSSGCIRSSKGFQMKRRYCNNPTPENTDAGCDGSGVEFGLCNDSNLCNKKISVVEYASEKCKEFSKLLPDLDKKGTGLQAPHEETRVWMGCAIFCKSANTGGFYTPRIELNDMGISPYFPDGTLCHMENNVKYYCLQQHCLPENFKFTKSTSVMRGIGEDIPISQNANPSSMISPDIKSYHSLGADGKPIRKTLNPSVEIYQNEEDWETNDYIEVPELKERYKLKTLFDDEENYI